MTPKTFLLMGPNRTRNGRIRSKGHVGNCRQNRNRRWRRPNTTKKPRKEENQEQGKKDQKSDEGLNGKLGPNQRIDTLIDWRGDEGTGDSDTTTNGNPKEEIQDRPKVEAGDNQKTKEARKEPGDGVVYVDVQAKEGREITEEESKEEKEQEQRAIDPKNIRADERQSVIERNKVGGPWYSNISLSNLEVGNTSQLSSQATLFVLLVHA